MPTYEYACRACGERREAVQSFSDDPLTECPACGGDLRKVYGNIGIAFKGSGFYKTDSRAGNGKRPGEHRGDEGRSSKESNESKESKESKGSESKDTETSSRSKDSGSSSSSASKDGVASRGSSSKESPSDSKDAGSSTTKTGSKAAS